MDLVRLFAVSISRYRAQIIEQQAEGSVVVIASPRMSLRQRSVSPKVTPRRFPPPWTVEGHNSACFIVRDANGQALSYFYFEDEPGRR